MCPMLAPSPPTGFPPIIVVGSNVMIYLTSYRAQPPPPFPSCHLLCMYKKHLYSKLIFIIFLDCDCEIYEQFQEFYEVVHILSSQLQQCTMIGVAIGKLFWFQPEKSNLNWNDDFANHF